MRVGEGVLVLEGGEISEEGIILGMRDGGVVLVLGRGGVVLSVGGGDLIYLGDVEGADLGDGSYVTIEVSVPVGVNWIDGGAYKTGDRVIWITEHEGADLEMSGLVLESNERITLISEWGSSGIERAWLVPTFMVYEYILSI